MEFNLKYFVSSLLLCILAFPYVLAVAPNKLEFSAAEGALNEVKNRGRQELGERNNFAALRITDSNQNEVDFNAAQLDGPLGIEKEIDLLENANQILRDLGSNGGYAFLLTQNSPCNPCIGEIFSFARAFRDVRFYVGYTKRWGSGHRAMDNSFNQFEFTDFVKRFPDNLRYIYLPRIGNPFWVTEP